MKITPDVLINPDTLSDEDNKLINFVKSIPYFIPRYFLIEFENGLDADFLDFYTRVGFGDDSESILIKCRISSSAEHQRVLFCNFIYDSDFSDACDDIYNYLDEFAYEQNLDPDPISMYNLAFGKAHDDPAVKLVTLAYLSNSNIGEFTSTKMIEEVERIKKAKGDKEKSIVESRKRNYANISVDFLLEP